MTWVIGLVITGVALYVVFPSLSRVIGAWPELSTLGPGWLVGALAAEVAAFTCNFGLQRLVLRTRGWFAVVAAGLVGNAVTAVLPGGDAAGAGVQFKDVGPRRDQCRHCGRRPDGRLAARDRRPLALPIFALPPSPEGRPCGPDCCMQRSSGWQDSPCSLSVASSSWPLTSLWRSSGGPCNGSGTSPWAVTRRPLAWTDGS